MFLVCLYQFSHILKLLRAIFIFLVILETFKNIVKTYNKSKFIISVRNNKKELNFSLNLKRKIPKNYQKITNKSKQIQKPPKH